MEYVLPHAEHKHYVRHIFVNWHKAFKGDEMKMMFWKATMAYNIAYYNEAIEELKKVNHAATAGFKGSNSKVFYKAFMKTKTKADVIMNNFVETFNNYIINARSNHLIYILEDIRTTLMQRLVLKRQEIEKCSTVVCPRIQAKLEIEKEVVANCFPMPSTNLIFQLNYNMDSLIVDLDARICTCRKWDLCGIPCSHAVSCIFFLCKNAKDFVDDCYKREAYLRAYSGSIPPCVGERHWPSIEQQLNPLPIKIGPGRLRENRRKDPHENCKKPRRLSMVLK